MRHASAADAPHQRGAFGRRDHAAGIHHVEEVRTLQAMIVGGENWEARVVPSLPTASKPSSSSLACFSCSSNSCANGGGVAAIETVLGELLLFGEADVAVGLVGGPAKIVDALDVLEERADAFQAVGEFDGDGVEVEAAALLEIGELRDLQSIEQYLPADSPSTERGGLPVVFLEANVVLLQFDADGGEALAGRCPGRRREQA